jgi:hypothetical protein
MTEPKPFPCTNCAQTLGYRDYDKLIVDGLEVVFKHSHKLKCRHCGCHTTFRVAGKEKQIDNHVKVT